MPLVATLYRKLLFSTMQFIYNVCLSAHHTCLVFTKTTKSRKNLKKSAADRRSVRSGANKTNTMAVLKKRALAEYSQVVQV